jgi:hypothetical protein
MLCDADHHASGTIRRSLAALAILQERQERLPRDSSRSNQVRNDIPPNFGILREDQRASDARFFQFEKATLLACQAIAELFKHAN